MIETSIVFERGILSATVACGLLCFSAADAGAQLPDLDVPPAVQFSGEIGSYGELYTVSGREQRRPSSMGRMYLRSSLVLFDAVSVDLDLLYSTESGSGIGLSGSTARQRLNQIGIEPKWSWGRGYLGSFADSYSNLTWNGVRVQGAGAAINPGWVRLGAFVGRSQNAIAGGALNGAYERTMWGGRIGVGRESRSGQGGYLDLVFLRAADDPNSLEIPDEEIVDDAAAGNPYAVTPQENVVVAAVNQLPFWSDRLIWRGEAAVSVHSRDRRAPELSDAALDDYSALLRSLVTPRASTYGDIAFTGQVDLQRLDLPGASATSPRTLSASIGYKYIGAGYVSLGLASLPADQRAVNTSVAVRYRTWSASLRALRQHDNLIGQKLATTVRNRFGGTFSLRATPKLNTTVRATLATVGNDAVDENHRVDFRSWTVATTQTLALGQERLLRTVSWNHSYQAAADATPTRAGTALRAHDLSVRVALEPATRLTVTPSVGVSLSSMGGADWDVRHTYALASSLRGEGGRWSTSAAISNSRLHAGGAIQASLSTRFRITTGDMVTVGVRSNRVSGLSTETGGFHEYTATIGWSRSLR